MFTKASLGLHQSCVEGLICRAVILKESRVAIPPNNHFSKPWHRNITAFITDTKGNVSVQAQLKSVAEVEAVLIIAKEAGYVFINEDIDRIEETTNVDNLRCKLAGTDGQRDRLASHPQKIAFLISLNLSTTENNMRKYDQAMMNLIKSNMDNY